MAGKIANIAGKVASGISKHAPEILTGVGIAASIGGTVLTVKSTIRAVRIYDQLEQDLGRKPTKKEVFKACAPCYIAPTAAVVVGAGCIISGNRIQATRYVSLGAAAKLIQDEAIEFRNSMTEKLGEKKVEQVEKEVVREKMAKNPPTDDNVYATDRGTDIVYDKAHDRYFTASYVAIKDAQCTINDILQAKGYISENDCYDLIAGLKPIAGGDERGFNYEALGRHGITIDITSDITNGLHSCLVMSFADDLILDYDRYCV